MRDYAVTLCQPELQPLYPLLPRILHGLPVSFNIADVLFKLAPRAHDLMAAAEAPELEIRAYAQHLPALFAAGVLLFHGDYITDLNIHLNLHQ